MWSNGEICVIDCCSASEFLHELDETHPRWQHATWIYRGQNVDKPLHPSAMRNQIVDEFVKEKFDEFNFLYYDGQERYREMWETESEEMWERHVRLVLHIVAERELAYTFEELADKVGLEISTETKAVLGKGHERVSLKYTVLTSLLDRDIAIDPTNISFALARHHGIPTRLLDWTFRPLHAAFFASEEEAEDDPGCAAVVVWAVSMRGLAWTSLAGSSHRRSHIGFLQAQDGLFLFDKEANSKYREFGCWQPFDHEFRKIPVVGEVFKLTLPVCKRQDLLRLLRIKHMSKPVLMPTFDNVADEITAGRIDWKSVNYPMEEDK